MRPSLSIGTHIYKLCLARGPEICADPSTGQAGHLPVSPEKEEVPLVVEGDYLSTLELGHRWEERLEEAADCVAQPSYEAVQDELGVVRCRACMALYNAYCVSVWYVVKAGTAIPRFFVKARRTRAGSRP